MRVVSCCNTCKEMSCVLCGERVVSLRDEDVLDARRQVEWFPVQKHRMAGVREQMACSLARAIFALEEPWRARFLKLVANSATSWQWNGRQPTDKEVERWLTGCPALYRHVRALLNAWQQPVERVIALGGR